MSSYTIQASTWPPLGPFKIIEYREVDDGKGNINIIPFEHWIEPTEEDIARLHLKKHTGLGVEFDLETKKLKLKSDVGKVRKNKEQKYVVDHSS